MIYPLKAHVRYLGIRVGDITPPGGHGWGVGGGIAPGQTDCRIETTSAGKGTDAESVHTTSGSVGGKGIPPNARGSVTVGNNVENTSGSDLVVPHPPNTE